MGQGKRQPNGYSPERARQGEVVLRKHSGWSSWAACSPPSRSCCCISFSAAKVRAEARVELVPIAAIKELLDHTATGAHQDDPCFRTGVASKDGSCPESETSDERELWITISVEGTNEARMKIQAGKQPEALTRSPRQIE